LAMAERVAGILPAIRRRDAFDTTIAKLRLTLPPGTSCLLRHNLVTHGEGNVPESSCLVAAPEVYF